MMYATRKTDDGPDKTDRMILPASSVAVHTGLIVINEQSVSLQAYYPSRSN